MADGGSSGLGWSGMGGAPPRTDAETASRAAGVLRAMASEASPAFYDVRVLVGDRAPFHAHRAVLAAQSSVFRAMFLSGMRETVENEVRLGDVQPAAFAAALRHVYGGSLAETSRAVLVEVSRFAHRMDMPALDAATTSILLRGMLAPLPDLRKAWQAEVAARSTERPAADLGPAAAPAAAQPPLMTHVAFGGFVPTMQAPTPAATAVFGVGQGSASGRSGEASVKVLAPRLRPPSPLTYLAAEITKVLDSPELLFFSFELLQRILSSDIVAAPEILLFEKAMAWIEADAERQPLLEDVLDLIRFDLMHSCDLARARQNTTAQPSSTFQARLLDALGLSEAPSASDDPVDELRSKRPRLLPRPHVVLALGVLNVRDRKLAVFRSQVLEIVAQRVTDAPSSQVWVKVSISCESSGANALSNVIAVPYIRSEDGRIAHVGRVIDESDFASRNGVPPGSAGSNNFVRGGNVGDNVGASAASDAPSFAQALQAAASARSVFACSRNAGDIRESDDGHDSIICGSADGGTVLVCVAFMKRNEIAEKDSPLAWTQHGASVAARPLSASPPLTFMPSQTTNVPIAGFNWNGIT